MQALRLAEAEKPSFEFYRSQEECWLTYKGVEGLRFYFREGSYRWKGKTIICGRNEAFGFRCEAQGSDEYVCNVCLRLNQIMDIARAADSNCRSALYDWITSLTGLPIQESDVSAAAVQPSADRVEVRSVGPFCRILVWIGFAICSTFANARGAQSIQFSQIYHLSSDALVLKNFELKKRYGHFNLPFMPMRVPLDHPLAPDILQGLSI